MAVWAYRCIPCRDPEHPRYVACTAVDSLDPAVVVVRLRTGRRWICARVYRGERLSVEGVVVRDVAPADANDCEGCKDE